MAGQHPDPAAWDTAFCEAVRANVRQLRYVGRVLDARARGTPPPRRSPGAYDARRTHGQVSRSKTGSRPRGRYITDEEYAKAQRRASAAKPLDLKTVLGTADA